MNAQQKSTNNWKNDLWKSIEEQDVMQLRNKLNEIRILTENQLQSYSMNSAEDAAGNRE
ncbi:MAG TPA: hypothetical protein VK872_07720 [Draconibacterium sp.]|jgi:hypothetical protein|nr:hypothetical protein [Draconibacterium sp.]